MKNYFYITLLFLTWTACRKEGLPSGGAGIPVFEAQYTTSGAGSVSVEAGVAGVYLFTDYHTDEQNYIVCTGAFSQTDCPDGDCPGGLRFEFRNTHPGTDFSPDSVFFIGNFAYRAIDLPSDSLYRTVFVPQSTGFSAFSWKINGQNAGQGDTLEYLSQNLNPLTVELTAQKDLGLTSTVRRTVSLASPGELYPSVDIQISSDSTSGFLLETQTSGTQVISTLWSTGDTTAEIAQDTLTDNYAVTVTDDFSSTAFAALQSLSPDDVPVSTANFFYLTSPVLISGGSVSIQWVDAQGSIWRSDRDIQPAGSTFTVTDSEPYEPNETGKKTRKMSVSFQCTLFNEAGESRPFSGTAVIAVAYP